MKFPKLPLFLVGLFPLVSIAGRFPEAKPPGPPIKVTMPPKPTGIPAGKALEALQRGNARYLSGGVTVRPWIQDQISVTGEQGQSPSIAILSCSDSRVPSELVFDMTVGELFVARIAGNYHDDDIIGTFEYGVSKLGVHTVLVLGHTKCGGVTAALQNAELHGSMSAFVRAIRPALEAAPGGVEAIKSTTEAAEINVRWQLAQILARSEILAKAKEEGKLQILMGIYDVTTGVVRFIN